MEYLTPILIVPGFGVAFIVIVSIIICITDKFQKDSDCIENYEPLLMREFVFSVNKSPKEIFRRLSMQNVTEDMKCEFNQNKNF